MMKCTGLGSCEITHAHIAGGVEKIVRQLRRRRRNRNRVRRRRVQLRRHSSRAPDLSSLPVDQLDVGSEIALHLDVRFRRSVSLGWTMRTKPVLRKSPGCADELAASSETCLQADQRELHFRRKAVVHANQRGRASAAAAADMIFVDDHDLSGFALRQMKCDGRTHDAGAENDDVGGSRQRARSAVGRSRCGLLQSGLSSSRAAPDARHCGRARRSRRRRDALPRRTSKVRRSDVRYCDHPGTGRMKKSCSRRRSP